MGGTAQGEGNRVILFLFHVWARKTPDGVGIHRGDVTAESKVAALSEARRWYPDKHLEVISDASWSAMSAKSRIAFAGRIADPTPVRVRIIGDTREITCRVCGKPITFTRDAEGHWPKRYTTYHPGRCQTQYNQHRQAQRAQRRTTETPDAPHELPEVQGEV